MRRYSWILFCLALSWSPAAAFATTADIDAAPGAASSGADPAGTSADDWHFDFETSATGGRLDGFLQTPLGGQLATTAHQPAFAQIGIKKANLSEGTLSFGQRQHRFVIAAHPIHLQGSEDAPHGFAFDGTLFPAGRVQSDLWLSWYEAGYSYGWQLGPRLSLTPTLRGALWSFDARLTANSLRERRAYDAATVRYGLAAQWQMFPHVALALESARSIPTRLQITTLRAGFIWNPPDRSAASGRAAWSVRTGVSYDRLRYAGDARAKGDHDGAALQLGPMWGLSFVYSF